MAYKFLEHTADVKVHVEAKSIAKAFSESALAFNELIFRHEKIEIAHEIKKKIHISGKDDCALLYNFLEEFLYLLDAEDFILSRISKIDVSPGKLDAELVGDNASNYKISNDVKAITYNEMKVEKQINRAKSGKINSYIIEFVVDV